MLSLAVIIARFADSFRETACIRKQEAAGQERRETIPHQLSRPVSCKTRGEFCDSWFVMIPVFASGSLVPGMLNTLKKSILRRKNICSRRRIDLNAEAFIDQSIGPSRYWFLIGCRFVSRLVRCRVPFFNGTKTVFDS